MRKRSRIFPRTFTDIVAFISIAFLSFLVFIRVLPVAVAFLQTSPAVGFPFFVLSGFVVVNLVGNWIQLLSVDTSILAVYCCNDVPAGWSLCACCQVLVPPRAHHCSVCEICILKRDHHCSISGCCVGFYNHRYYIALLFHYWWGALFALGLNYASELTWQCCIANGYWSIFYHIFPFLFWIMGSLEWTSFFVFFASAVTLYGLLFVTALFAYHWNLIVAGQTAFEKCKNVKKYSHTNWEENVTEVLGPKWIVALLWFQAESPLPGDGQHFRVAGKNK